MQKVLRVAIYMLIISLAMLSCVLYKNNSKLKNDLGLTYLSNITIYKLHITQIEYYLQNEKEFKESDLSKYYDKANMLMAVKIPSDSIISSYPTLIQRGIMRIKDLVSEGTNNNEIEATRDNTLQLLNTLNDGLEKMSKVGIVRAKDGKPFKEDGKRYYQLGLFNNKLMESINADLDKQLKKYWNQ